MADGIVIDIQLDTRALDRILAQLPGRVEDVLDKVVTDIGAVAVQSMEGPKHGVVYMHGKTPHHASASGEAPAVDTGNLKNSWFVRKSRGKRVFGFTANYAPHLEFGTSRMGARPFFLPAIVRGSSGLVTGLRALADGQEIAGWRKK